MKKKIIGLVFLILLVGVGLMVYLGQKETQLKELYYSGTIEATQANLAFRVNGRVQDVLVDEGREVKGGQVLVMLDQAEPLARRNQAQADLDRSVNELKRIETILELNRKVIPTEVERAEAAVKSFRSQLAELEAGYRVQDVEQARLTVQKSQATLEEARKDKDRFESLYKAEIVSEQERDVSALKYETALRESERVKEAYDLLKEGFRKESIDTARSRLKESEVALKQARNNLKKIEITEKEMDVAGSRVAAAEAGLELARIQLDYTVLKAPFAGIIVSRNIEPGEVVSPGREVISLSDLFKIDLKIFVDETEIGKVKPGQKVEVRIDTFPDKKYWGRVSFISPQGEFTPKIIQTHKERVKLVYLVKVSIPNPELELKPGIPADAWLR
ncbi:efflux RND transporter periplasmic adaptor subunit [Thermodesulfobacteriota bacterium]